MYPSEYYEQPTRREYSKTVGEYERQHEQPARRQYRDSPPGENIQTTGRPDPWVGHPMYEDAPGSEHHRIIPCGKID